LTLIQFFLTLLEMLPLPNWDTSYSNNPHLRNFGQPFYSEQFHQMYYPQFNSQHSPESHYSNPHQFGKTKFKYQKTPERAHPRKPKSQPTIHPIASSPIALKEVPVVGGFASNHLSTLSETDRQYIEMRKKRFPNKEKSHLEKLEREKREARGELVDIPNFKEMNSKVKPSKRARKRPKKDNSDGDSLLKKLFTNTVISENVAILQCIRYIVANNFFYETANKTDDIQGAQY
jgi:hypothetical protein